MDAVHAGGGTWLGRSGLPRRASGVFGGVNPERIWPQRRPLHRRHHRRGRPHGALLPLHPRSQRLRPPDHGNDLRRRHELHADRLDQGRRRGPRARALDQRRALPQPSAPPTRAAGSRSRSPSTAAAGGSGRSGWATTAQRRGTCWWTTSPSRTRRAATCWAARAASSGTPTTTRPRRRSWTRIVTRAPAQAQYLKLVCVNKFDQSLAAIQSDGTTHRRGRQRQPSGSGSRRWAAARTPTPTRPSSGSSGTTPATSSPAGALPSRPLAGVRQRDGLLQRHRVRRGAGVRQGRPRLHPRRHAAGNSPSRPARR